MPISPARSAAAAILLRVEREESYASELLHSSRYATLSTEDHGLTTELVMGVLRWRSRLDRSVADFSDQRLERLDQEVLTALRLGAYQLLLLARIPARAAIFESVELVKRARKRSAAPFVNAVLRKLSASKAEFKKDVGSSPSVEVLAQRSAHPEWLVARWAAQYGLEAARSICGFNQSVPQTAIHVPAPETQGELEQFGVSLRAGSLLANARRVESGDLTASRAFREGRISIQDEASQLVSLLVGSGKNVLDCCAAPGSKTTLIASRNPTAKVTAVDLHAHRAKLLRRLCGRANVQVVAADARQLPFANFFDRILADVPCSGTGTLARNPEIKWRLKADDLRDLQARQIAILKSALARLAPGGRLVYSTCSLEREENEVVVETALEGTSEFTIADCRRLVEHLRKSGELVLAESQTLTRGLFLQTLPGVHPCDGFFAAVMERQS